MKVLATSFTSILIIYRSKISNGFVSKVNNFYYGTLWKLLKMWTIFIFSPFFRYFCSGISFAFKYVTFIVRNHKIVKFKKKKKLPAELVQFGILHILSYKKINFSQNNIFKMLLFLLIPCQKFISRKCISASNKE